MITFSLYDMNNDGFICEYDLFSFIKHSNDKIFDKLISDELKSILKAVSKKKDLPKFANEIFCENFCLENFYSINDVPKFLEERKIINHLKSNFHTLVSDKIPAKDNYMIPFDTLKNRE